MESPKISPQSQDNADVLEDSGCNLVLHNDDVHTFDYVIKSLVDICRISYAQAEQCTILVHCHGKSSTAATKPSSPCTPPSSTNSSPPR